jgi:hypothetical protein
MAHFLACASPPLSPVRQLTHGPRPNVPQTVPDPRSTAGIPFLGESSQVRGLDRRQRRLIGQEYWLGRCAAAVGDRAQPPPFNTPASVQPASLNHRPPYGSHKGNRQIVTVTKSAAAVTWSSVKAVIPLLTARQGTRHIDNCRITHFRTDLAETAFSIPGDGNRPGYQ